MQNPFTLSFGKKPVQYISRISQTSRILETFQAEEAVNQIFMITGVRGSGKTVMMTSIAEEMKKEEQWIVVELNPLRDLLQSLAAKLYSIPQIHERLVRAKLDFSAFGLGVSLEYAVPVTDIEDALLKMMEQIKKAGKRLLITIDEVTNSEKIRVFSSAFQIFLRENAPVYLLMTGLYENIYELQNDKSLTFLYRAPKMILEPLNYTAIRKTYQEIFQTDPETAGKMAGLTKGYPFAFQVLGYLCWEKREELELESILPEYDQYLEEYVYSKIWSELSEKDREVLTVLAETKEENVKKIREQLKMSPGMFSVYRERLKRKGVLDTREYGKVLLALPRFAEFVQTQQW